MIFFNNNPFKQAKKTLKLNAIHKDSPRYDTSESVKNPDKFFLPILNKIKNTTKTFHFLDHVSYSYYNLTNNHIYNDNNVFMIGYDTHPKYTKLAFIRNLDTYEKFVDSPYFKLFKGDVFSKKTYDLLHYEAFNRVSPRITKIPICPAVSISFGVFHNSKDIYVASVSSELYLVSSDLAISQISPNWHDVIADYRLSLFALNDLHSTYNSLATNINSALPEFYNTIAK